MDDKLLRLKATLLIQTADTSSVLAVVQAVADTLRDDYPELPDVGAQFLKRRTELVQLMLEDYEKKDPALAARMQQMIDESSKYFPFDYE
jgi:hypothetical protein